MMAASNLGPTQSSFAQYAGLLVAGTIALASTWLAQHYTTPVMLFALLFGMSFHFSTRVGVR